MGNSDAGLTKWLESYKRSNSNESSLPSNDPRSWKIYSHDTELKIIINDSGNSYESHGRAIFTRMRCGEQVSLTYRHLGKPIIVSDKRIYFLPKKIDTNTRKLIEQQIENNDLEAENSLKDLTAKFKQLDDIEVDNDIINLFNYLSSQPKCEDDYLLSFAELHNFVFRRLQSRGDQTLPQGLLIISGATKSGKSEMSRALIARWLIQARCEKKGQAFEIPIYLQLKIRSRSLCLMKNTQMKVSIKNTG